MILLVLIVISAFYYFVFLFQVRNGLLKYTSSEWIPTPMSEKVSVIIPYRNEIESLPACLNSISKQDYKSDLLEVIFVDDGSDDGSTEFLLNNVEAENLRIISIDSESEVKGNKKAAIRFGIENANGDIIITTDADCVHDKSWIRTMIEAFEGDNVFLSGPVVFHNCNTVFQKLQKLEFAGLILTGAGLIGSNSPKICNGANLAYRKRIFFKVGGFDGDNLSSGDDELLMQKISKLEQFSIDFVFNKRAVVKTEPKKKLMEFINQRKRWASKSLFYKDKIFVFKLMIIFVFYLLLLISFILGIILGNYLLILALILFFMKAILEYNVMKEGVGLLFDKIFLNKYFLLTQIFQIPYIVFSSILGLFGNYEWKGRRVNR